MNQYESVAEVGFTANTSSEYLFPVLYESFIDGECFLYEPLRNPLVQGETVEFRCRFPGFKEVYILVNDSRFDLKRGDDDIFSGRITIPVSSKLGIYGAKTENAKSYTGLLGYTISKK